ncbi:hypothetical protein BJ912DRAFT_956728 [Pholiota molesta]|nr:hypothetical protein BJ912DRAFT_956728 [Pholiota molesta]
MVLFHSHSSLSSRLSLLCAFLYLLYPYCELCRCNDQSVLFYCNSQMSITIQPLGPKRLGLGHVGKANKKSILTT